MTNATEVPKAPVPAGYPAAWEFDGLLTSGEAVLVRPVLPEDAEALIEFHAALSPETQHRRYFAAHPVLSPAEAARFVGVDYRDRMSFVALVRDRFVAYANFERFSSTSASAEVAFVVADEFQHRGVATLLFESLAAFARGVGIGHFVAEVLPENGAMIDVFVATGLDCARELVDGAVRVKLDLTPTAAYRASCDAREATAEVASIAAILRPASIAVVGAGRRPGSVGHDIVRALLAGDFSGTVYPVNPHARSVCGVPAYPSLSALPEPIDLAVIALPSGGVPAVVEEAAAIGVRAATVITAGFAEAGGDGAAVEHSLLRTARRSGMRLVGPNCLGVVNCDPEVRMNATFGGVRPGRGPIALVSQSGAVGIVLADQARLAGLGLSAFVSVGNKLDVSSNDLLCYFEADESTKVIALYLESFGNPRKFARIARRVGARKPIIALKAGRTDAGARGARSHTAAAATPEVVVSALLASAGVIQVEHLEELLDVAAVLSATGVPHGGRVALVGNSGGPLILAADACESRGLTVPVLALSTQEALRAFLVPAAAVANPVDLTADGDGAVLEAAIAAAATDEGIDAVVVVVTDLTSLPATVARDAVARAGSTTDKPVLACILGATRKGGEDGAVVAELATPERAAAALAYVTAYGAWRSRPHTPVGQTGSVVDHPRRRELVEAHFATDPEGGWLPLDAAADLLAASGVPVLETIEAEGEEEAAAVATTLGYPVAMKVRAGSIVHKSDVGGVVLNIADEPSLRRAYREMTGRLGAGAGGVVIQSMAPSGVEAIVGLASDPVFGPVVMVGLGGVMTDLIGDRAFGVPPLELGAAARMVSSLRTAPLLRGYRGARAVDEAALVGVIEAVARLVEEVPEVIEVDCNPVVVSSTGAVVLDCKVRVAPVLGGPGPLFRALRS